jgi:hypothetical protein
VAGRNGAVVRRLQLGRILREQAELSLEVAAPALDWSSSKLSRIENGLQGVDVHGVRTMMDIYEVGGPQWDELLDLTRLAAKKGAPHSARRPPGNVGRLHDPRLRRPGLPDMVYVEHPVGAVHVFAEADVARARLVFDRLLALALDTDESAVLIEGMAREM